MNICICVLCVCMCGLWSVCLCAKMCHLWFCKDRMVAGELCKPVFSNKLNAKLINEKMCLQNVDKSWKLPFSSISLFFFSFLNSAIFLLSIYLQSHIMKTYLSSKCLHIPKGYLSKFLSILDKFNKFSIKFVEAQLLCN